MSKKLMVLAIFMASMFLFSGCMSSENEAKPATQVKKGPLKIGMTKSEYKPMQCYEGSEQPQGFDAEFVKLVAKEMGRDVEFKFTPWKSIFDNLANGDYDLAVSAITITDERKKIMIFSDPYFDSSTAIVSLKEKNILSAKDLTNKKLGIQKDTNLFDNIKQNIPGVEFIKFDDSEGPWAALLKGQSDAAVGDLPIAAYFTKQNKDKGFVFIMDKNQFPVEQFAVAARKGNEPLIAEFNAAFAKVKSNGEYKKLYDKYFGNN